MRNTENLEATILGTMLRHSTTSHDAIRKLSTEDFGTDAHRRVFAVLTKFVHEGRQIDAFEAEAQLGTAFENPMALIAGLMSSAGAPENLEIRIADLHLEVRNERMRSLLEHAIDAMSGRFDADKIKARLIERLVNLEDNLERGESKTLKQAMTEAIENLEETFQARMEGRSLGINTGIDLLDEITGGLRKTDLIIVGGHTGMGKTAFMMTAALSAAKRGAKVGVISTEMSAEQLGIRVAAMTSHVAGDKFRKGNMGEHDFAAIAAAVNGHMDLPIQICDNPVMSISSIFALAKSWQLLHGLDVLFVDYLTRVAPEGKSESRALEVGHIAEGMKNIAKRLKIPVVALAQLNRVLHTRQDKRPNLGDLRDSGMIEQEADQIFFLYRPWVYDKQANPTEAEILIGKNRHGETAVIRCMFEPATMTWSAGSHDEWDR